MDQGLWMGYNWVKPKRIFTQLRMNVNTFYSRLVTPIDILKRKEMMYQSGGGSILT